jgi:predicted AAA+ superfamily ATPase
MKRRTIQSPKFYYFDLGIVNYLLKRKNIEQGTDTFGHAFEHLLMQEIIAYMAYSLSDEKLSYWRTASGYEVDCIIGEGRVAIEFKSSNEIQLRQTRGLKAFQEEYPQSRAVIVSMDKHRRNLHKVEVILAIEFLADLWKGKIV